MKQVALAAVFCVLIAIPARATRIRALSLTEIRDSAAAILIVDVRAVSSRIGDARMPWTDYEVRIGEVLRGAKRTGDLLTLSFAGGTERGIAGVPRLAVGRRYLVFVDDAERRPVPARGWSEGIFEVPATPDGALVSLAGSALVVDDSGRIRRVRPLGDARLRLPEPVAFNADGSVVVAPDRIVTSDAASSRPATMSDVRRFLARELVERER